MQCLRAEPRALSDAESRHPFPRAGAGVFYPGVRSNHAAVEINGAVLIHGGGTKKDRYADAYLAQTGGSKAARTLYTRRVDAPNSKAGLPILSFHAGACVASNTLVLFGGADSANADSNALWAVTLPASAFAGESKNTIAAVQGSATQVQVTRSNWPAARRCHSMARHAGTNVVVLSGGAVGDKFKPLHPDELLWMLVPAGTTNFSANKFGLLPDSGSYVWTRPHQTGALPGQRWGHVLLALPNSTHMLMVSGNIPTDDPNVTPARDCGSVEVLTLHGESIGNPSISWSQIAVNPELPPRRRLGAACSLDGAQVLVFGGYGTPNGLTTPGYFGDLVTLAAPVAAAIAAARASSPGEHGSTENAFSPSPVTANASGLSFSQKLEKIAVAQIEEFHPGKHSTEATVLLLADMGFAYSEVRTTLRSLYDARVPSAVALSYDAWVSSQNTDVFLERLMRGLGRDDGSRLAASTPSFIPSSNYAMDGVPAMAMDSVPNHFGGLPMQPPLPGYGLMGQGMMQSPTNYNHAVYPGYPMGPSQYARVYPGGAPAPLDPSATPEGRLALEASMAPLRAQITALNEQLAAARNREAAALVEAKKYSAAAADASQRFAATQAAAAKAAPSAEMASKLRADLFAGKSREADLSSRVDALTKGLEDRAGWYSKQMSKVVSRCGEKIDSVSLCCICLLRPRNVFTLPCAHLLTCVECYTISGAVITNVASKPPAGGAPAAACPTCRANVGIAYVVRGIADSLSIADLQKLAAAVPPPLAGLR
jgi:hypothetical protein